MDLIYTDHDGTDRAIPRREFLALLETNRADVLRLLRVESAPLRPRFVDVARPDGSIGVGAVAGHVAPPAEPYRAPGSGPGPESLA